MWRGHRRRQPRLASPDVVREDPRAAEHRLALPVHAGCRFVLVAPHYPENVGAAARALKAMGFGELWLVRPGRLAQPSHGMARRMAVKSQDVLAAARVVPTLDEATQGVSLVLGTTARRGVSRVLVPRDAARLVVAATARQERVALLFGNEKTGLGAAELALCHERVRIPMAAGQPSINLAQAVQVLAYELFVEALSARGGAAMLAG